MEIEVQEMFWLLVLQWCNFEKMSYIMCSCGSSQIWPHLSLWAEIQMLVCQELAVIQDLKSTLYNSADC